MVVKKTKNVNTDVEEIDLDLFQSKKILKSNYGLRKSQNSRFQQIVSIRGNLSFRLSI